MTQAEEEEEENEEEEVEGYHREARKLLSLILSTPYFILRGKEDDFPRNKHMSAAAALAGAHARHRGKQHKGPSIRAEKKSH